MKSSIEVKQIDIVDLKVDAVVNAANTNLLEGGGVCGAIFKKAGSKELRDACGEIGGCTTGSAVITQGFKLPAKYIIHAVGPVWGGGDNNEAELLFNAYKNSLILAKENDCHSIAFPLISSGIYGYPKKQAWQIAVKACSEFIDDNTDYSMRIIFAVLSVQSLKLGESTIAEFKANNRSFSV